jgi:hypothetical protein
LAVLGYVVLALALFGLAAVIAEIFVKNPDALIQIARDSERFARTPSTPTPRAAAAVPANDSDRRAAA